MEQDPVGGDAVLEGEVNLLCLPEEVFLDALFPFLPWNDVLRLRRVCQALQVYSDIYLRNNFGLTAQEREINSGDKNLQAFLDLGLPSTHINLDNRDAEQSFFDDPLIPEFLERYASHVTHLSVYHFGTCYFKPERDFYRALTNLQHLDIVTTDATKRKCNWRRRYQRGQVIFRRPCYFPPNFKNLKTLKFNLFEGSSKNDCGYAWDFIQFCPQLEYIRHPNFSSLVEIEGRPHKNGVFGCVMGYIEWRAKKFPDRRNLQIYDLESQDLGRLFGEEYLALVRCCFKYGVQLGNVDASYHSMEVEAELEGNYETFGVPLRSLNDVVVPVFLAELPNLEKLDIQATSCCSFAPAWDGTMPRWPNLKILEVAIDSEELGEEFDSHGNVYEALPTAVLLHFLLASVKREGLKDLRIRYDKRNGEGSWEEDELPVPRAADISRTCGNVTKLTLVNWRGTNKAVSCLWRGLEQLEEVVLEECRGLGNVAFVGEDRERPTFLGLTKIRKLSLLGLDEMPKITDLIFELVFRNVSLKQFYLTSRKPVKSISATGIRKLLTGTFSKSVEKFPFKDWSLEGVSEEEFTQLETQFRSFNML